METTPTSMVKSENATESDHQSETSNVMKNDDVITSHFRDYESLLEYCVKLMEESKDLLAENRDLHKTSEVIVTMGIELREQNETLKKEKENLVEDSILMMEYNQQLMETKSSLEQDLQDIKNRYANLLDLLSTGIKQQLLELEIKDNGGEQ